MIQPVKSGQALIEEIDTTLSETPVLWWLGHSGFVVRFATITFYVDPCFSTRPGQTRLIAAPLSGAEVRNADMILSTNAQTRHLDAATLIPMLQGSKNAKLVLPKGAAGKAHAAGIPYERMTTTDADLRVEYFKSNLYARIYAVPAAHPQLDWTAATGYRYLGYLMRFGRWTIYHAGDCVPYEDLADRLRPYNVTVALLPWAALTFRSATLRNWRATSAPLGSYRCITARSAPIQVRKANSSITCSGIGRSSGSKFSSAVKSGPYRKNELHPLPYLRSWVRVVSG